MALFFKHKKIKSEKSLGEKLTALRQRQGSSLDVAEESTRVNMKYLLALEANDYKKLPAEVYVIGFLRRYADWLGTDSHKIIENYRQEQKLYFRLNQHQDKSRKPGNILKPNPGKKWLKSPSFVITPKLLISSLVIVFVLGIIGYIFYQVKSFAAAPPLEIAGSLTNMKVKVSEITVEGQTDSSASLSINNQPVAVDPKGHFTQEIKLISGINEIEVVAKNKAGKTTRQVIKILAEY